MDISFGNDNDMNLGPSINYKLLALLILGILSAFLAGAEPPIQSLSLKLHTLNNADGSTAQVVSFVAAVEDLRRATNSSPDFLKTATSRLNKYVNAARSHLVETKEIAGKLELAEVTIWPRLRRSGQASSNEAELPSYWWIEVSFSVAGSGMHYLSGPELTVGLLPDYTVVRKVFLEGREMIKSRQQR